MNRQTALILAILASAEMWSQTDSIIAPTHQLQEVTISQSRRQRALSAVAPVHILDRSDMLTMGVADMGDALRRIPGITLRDYGGAGGVKTVAVRGFGAKHTGVSYDGVMLSDCQSGEIDLSRYALDNVTELSLTVGDNDDIFLPARNVTTPAVLNIRTIGMPSGDRQPHITTQVKWGSFGLISPFLRYEQSLSDKFSLSAVAEYTYAENDYPYTIHNITITTHDRRTNSRMNSGHGEINFVWNTQPTSRLTGKVYYYDNSRQLPGQVRYYTNVSGETLHDRNFFSQLAWQKRWGSLWSAKFTAKTNWAKSVYRDALYAGGINDATYWQREYYASAAVLYVPSENWAVDYSADYALNNLNGSSKRAVMGHPYRHSILQSATVKYHTGRLTAVARLLHSLYLNHQKDVGVSDGRLDVQVNSAKDMRRLSPSASISVRLSNDECLHLRAGYKNIFRTPTFNESYYYHYGSTDLDAESTDQWNLGVTWAPKLSRHTSMNITADGYYNHVKNMIVAVPYNMFVWTCINIGRVRSIGADFNLRIDHMFSTRHKLYAAGSYSLQKVENRTNRESPNFGKQIAYMPEHTYSGSIGYENPWVNLSVHATGMSSRWPNNEHYPTTMVEGFVDFGVTAYRQFQIGKHRIEVRGDLKNLFDKQYSIVALYPMPGRSYQMTLNYKF